MTGASRLPAGWHATTPRLRVVTTERVVADDAPDPEPPSNRAGRRAARRAITNQEEQVAERPDTCRPVEIDGETIRVHGEREMTEEERSYLAEVIQAVKRKYLAEHPEEQPAGHRHLPGARISADCPQCAALLNKPKEATT